MTGANTYEIHWLSQKGIELRPPRGIHDPVRKKTWKEKLIKTLEQL